MATSQSWVATMWTQRCNSGRLLGSSRVNHREIVQTIIAAAVVPAFMHFFGVFMQVHW